MKYMYQSNQQNTVYNEKNLLNVFYGKKLTEDCVTLMQGCRFAFLRTLGNKFDV